MRNESFLIHDLGMRGKPHCLNYSAAQPSQQQLWTRATPPPPHVSGHVTDIHLPHTPYTLIAIYTA